MINEEIRKLLQTFITMSSEKNGDVLLEKILSDAIDITNCDGGTLYIINNNKLEFKVMETRSLNIKKGGSHEKVTLPPVEMTKSNVCAYCVLENKLINIPDVYESSLFDFSGPKNYDKLTNYKTKSMIVVPMEDDRGEIIGVMQLLNAQNQENEIISFSKKSEMILKAIASLAAIRIVNMNYTHEIKELMESIVRTFAEVIYLRTPYNVSHTHNMERYASKFLKWLDENPSEKFSMSEENKQLFIMSIWLHDIGKLITPLEIMDKATRLSAKLERVMTRLDIIALTTKINCLKQQIDCTLKLEEIEKTREFVIKVNTMPFLNEETLEEVKKLEKKTYEDENGVIKKWFTEDEIKDLSIIKGTLTDEEREVMQNHVKMTAQILEKMNFKQEYTKVPLWACSHHELLDGKGYPNKLTCEDLDPETRLLTILDIFDGLSAKDRPYKKSTPIEKVFEILEDMAQSNKIDKDLLNLFKESEVWKTQEHIK